MFRPYYSPTSIPLSTPVPRCPRVFCRDYNSLEEETQYWNLHQALEKSHRSSSEAKRFHRLKLHERTPQMRKDELQDIFDRVDIQERNRMGPLENITNRVSGIALRPPPGLRRDDDLAKRSPIKLDTESIEKVALLGLWGMFGENISRDGGQKEPTNPRHELQVMQGLVVGE